MLARPRRSVLYMPGSNARAMAKAKTLPADSLILDLEDSVAPDQKIAARGEVASAVRAGGFGGREVVIRVNGPHTPWGEADLAAASVAGPDAILLPKVDGPGAIMAAARTLREAGAPERTRIWAMMENSERHFERRLDRRRRRRFRPPAFRSWSWASTTSPRRRGQGSPPAVRP